ncbi:MAG: DUF3788 family protein [Planctomycetes bacterium]|nr:DUF3788 family protein [Planctomycetota bacterium]
MPDALFNDKFSPPSPAALAAGLGKTLALWTALADLAALAGGMGEWKFYGAKYGWQFKVVRGKRSLLYLIPGPGKFTAAMALDREAVGRLDGSGLPREVVVAIRSAKKAPEGQPARVEVTGKKEEAIARKLVEVKVGRQV